MESLELTPEQAIAQKKIDALVVALYADERPLRGLAHRLDWRLAHAITRCLESGIAQGEAGECVYLPIQKEIGAGETDLIRLILVGGGETGKTGERKALPASTISHLEKNLKHMGLARIGISREDLGASLSSLKSFRTPGVELCLTQ